MAVYLSRYRVILDMFAFRNRSTYCPVTVVTFLMVFT